MKKNNKQTGYLGETLAAEYLEKEGYRILNRNWGSRWGEIDIISEKGGVVVFVEVKTKTSLSYGYPREMVNSRKLAQIARIAAVYPAGKNKPKRIDVVSVVLARGRSPVITHYRAVY